MSTMLFNVPRQPTRLERLKADKQIDTFHSPGVEEPWIAVHMPSASEIAKPYYDGDVNTLTIPELFARWCRLLEEANVSATGDTEADAVFRVCQGLNIPCVL